MHTLCRATAEAHGATATVAYRRGVPAHHQHRRETDVAIAAARAVPVAGAGRVQFDCRPSMASKTSHSCCRPNPGAYIWLGADGAGPSLPLHNPRYDFNDDTLGLGAAYWVSLVESE